MSTASSLSDNKKNVVFRSAIKVDWYFDLFSDSQN